MRTASTPSAASMATGTVPERNERNRSDPECRGDERMMDARDIVVYTHFDIIMCIPIYIHINTYLYICIYMYIYIYMQIIYA